MKPVEIYTTQTCPYCIAAKRLLLKKGVDFKEIDVGGQPQLRAAMTQILQALGCDVRRHQ